MNIKFWLDRWSGAGEPSHRPTFQPGLIKHFPVDPPGTVLVPLCGKTLDMLWLAEQGWKVIGIEASPVACKAFFEENKLACKTEQRGHFTVYAGEKITLWCGDFFKTEKKDLPEITAAYDRAALVALPEDLRRKYAAHLTALLPGPAKMLLIAIDYPQEKIPGPPFSVDSAEIHELYGEHFKITELRRREDTVMPKINPKFEGLHPQETVYMLQSYI